MCPQLVTPHHHISQDSLPAVQPGQVLPDSCPVSDRESDEPGELMRENLNCAVTRRPHPDLDLLLQMEIIVKLYNSLRPVDWGC